MSINARTTARVMKFLKRRQEQIPVMEKEVRDVMLRWGIWGSNEYGDLDYGEERTIRHRGIDMWRGAIM